MKKIIFPILSLIIFCALGTTMVYAQPGGNPVGVTLENPFGSANSTLFALFRTIINQILMPIGGVLAVMAFIYSGFLYVVAQGNEAKLKTAHKSLLYTSIGTAVLLGSWVLANVVCRTIASLGGPACPI